MSGQSRSADLCAQCKTLPTLRELNNNIHTLHDSFQEFQSCSCPFCQWLCRLVIEDMNLDPQTMLAEDSPVELYGDLDIPQTHAFAFSSMSFRVGVHGKELDLLASPDNPAAKYVTGRMIERNSSSNAAIKLVKDWITHCQRSHPECTSASMDFTLPTYLIDIGKAGEVEGLRLIQTSPDQPDKRYITLSYVWGVAAQPIMLTKGTKSSLMKNIPEEKLPQTHKDVIKVARWLNVPYLWIDALCIIQDDTKEEKMKEIVKMDRIFGNSLLTVQATRAASVNEGFLGPQKDPQPAPSEIPYPLVKTPDRVFVRTGPPLRPSSYGPADARAWCYEEGVLPRRVLVYGQQTLIFKCMKRRSDDYGRESDITTQGPPSLWNLSPWYKDTSVPKDARHADPVLDMLKFWYRTLDMHYTPRLLTKPGDRLIAIGGLVRQLQKHIPGPYIAGLWQVDLPWCLLWHCRRGMHNRVVLGLDILKATGYSKNPTMMSMSRPKGDQKRSPSWSWAALDGGTNHVTVQQRYALDAKGNTSASRRRVLATFDQIPRALGEGTETRGLGELAKDEAAFHISAPLYEMTIVYRDDERWKKFDQQASAKGGIYKSRSYIIPYVGGENTTEVQKLKNVPVGAIQLDLSEEEERPGKVWCLLIVDGIGLALDCVDEAKKTFTRKGVFFTTRLWPDALNDINPTSVCII